MNKKDIRLLFDSIDSFDTRTFVSYLDEEANFKFGNMPVIKGKDAIFNFVAGFFQAIKAIRHSNLEVFELKDVSIVNATVTYTRLDRSTLTVNFSKTFKLKNGKIKDYLIFIDNSELFK